MTTQVFCPYVEGKESRIGDHYFRASGLTAKTMALVARIADIQVDVHKRTPAARAQSDQSASTAYNILLKDDKSPHLFNSGQNGRDSAFTEAPSAEKVSTGPYPSAGSVRSTLHLMQKVFKVRQCEDSFSAIAQTPSSVSN